MRIFATSLSDLNPFEKVVENEGSFIIQKITIIVAPIISAGCLTGIVTLYVLQGFTSVYWIPMVITSVAALSAGSFTVALFSVSGIRTYKAYKQNAEIKIAPGNSTPIPEPINVISPPPTPQEPLPLEEESAKFVVEEEVIQEAPPQEGPPQEAPPIVHQEIREPKKAIPYHFTNEELALLEEIMALDLDEPQIPTQVEEIVALDLDEPEIPPQVLEFPRAHFKALLDLFPKKKEEKKPSVNTRVALLLDSQNVILSQNSLELIAFIESEYSWLLDRNAFNWLKNIDSPTKDKNPKLESTKREIAPYFFDLKNHLLEALAAHWEECSKGYPRGAIEKALTLFTKNLTLNKRGGEAQKENYFAWGVLYPLLLRFFYHLGSEREAFFLEVISATESFLQDLERDSPNPTALFCIELFKNLILPFKLLLSEKEYHGKKFLIHLIHAALFQIWPMILQSVLEDKQNDYKATRKKRKKEKANIDNSIRHYQQIQKKIKVYATSDQLGDALDIVPLFQEALEEWKEALVKLKKANSAKGGQIFFLQTTLNEVLPFLAKYTSDLFEIGEPSCPVDEIQSYLHRLKEIKNDPFGIPAQQPLGALKIPDAPYSLTKEAVELVPTIDHFALALKEVYVKNIKTELPSLFLGSQRRKKYVELHRDALKILDALSSFIPTIFGDSATSIGDFLAKTFLITPHWLKIYPDKESRANLIKQLITLLTEPLKEAGIDTRQIEALAAVAIEDVLKKLENPDIKISELEEIWQRFPLHDLFLVIFFVLFGVRHFEFIRPWLANHSDSLVDIILEIGDEEIKEDETAIRWGFKVALKILAPLSGLALGSYPGKGSLVRAGVALSYSIGRKKADSFRAQRVRDGEIDEERAVYEAKIDNLCFDLSQPFVTFLFLALFGGGWWGGSSKAEKALSSFEEKLSLFYRGLYTFDPHQMAADAPALQSHLQSHLNTLLNSKKFA